MLIQINTYGYGTGFDTRIEFYLPGRSIGKNITMFGADTSSSVYNDNNLIIKENIS